jgi:DNA-binding SARP family transcriptional activator
MHPRETLATLLWADLTPQQARKNFRKVLYTLQHFLSDVTGPDVPPLLLIKQDWIAINSTTELHLDIAVFEQAYALAQQKMGTRLDAQAAQILTDAVQLYEGELLTGLYDDWCLYERERLENMYLELLHILMVYAEAGQAYEQAISYGLEILRHDGANERTYYDLMRLYYCSGNRTAALHQYEHCVAALEKELGVRPCKTTRLVYEQICRDEFALPPGDPDTSNPHRQLSAYAEAHHQLQQIHKELQATLNQVQEKIYFVERLMQS